MQQGQQQNRQQQWTPSGTVFSFEADTPDLQQRLQIAERLQNEPGVREIALLREGTTPRIRVGVGPESISAVQQVCQQVLQNLQQTYAGSGSYSG
jgi:hypothetical protein